MTPPTYRRRVAAVLFLAAIAAVVVMNRGANGSAAGGSEIGFSLRNVAAEIGIDFTHSRPTLDPKLANVEPHIAALGAAVSVADANGDGHPDLYFTNSAFGRPNALYLNRGDGTFQEGAAAAGIADLNRPGEGVSMGAVWGDYDNDGREDVLVYRYGYLALFRNAGDLRFEDVTEAAGLRRWVNSNGAIWFDYDKDGRLDLYVTAYFRSDVDLWHVGSTQIMHNSFEFAGNGGRNLLFHNAGDGRFTPVPDSLAAPSTRWTMAAASADFNDDGWPDLYLANDYGPEELFLNQEGRRFVLAQAGLETNSKSGMSVTLGDLHNRGRLDVFVSNISEPGYLFQSNNLRINLLAEAGRFENIAEGPVANAGWAWGAQAGDFDNDGRTDLFVANGFVSADREKSYWYAMSKIAGANGNIFEDTRNWPPFDDASLSGYERSRVLRNLGDRGWMDVAEAAGVTDEYDGRAVALVDLFDDGALDIVVANQNQPAVVYRNTPDPANHWIEFALTGTVSNRSAIGAEVIVEAAGTRRRRVVDGGSGFASQNDRRIHVGLGRSTRADRVTIRWPSGLIQTIERLEADRLHAITEPGATP